MRNHGIIFTRDGQEHVYTDSTYFVDWNTAKRLYDFADEIKPIDCEIDAYGDFLQALGPEASADYTKNVANVTKETSSLVEKRKKIFEFLKGTPLNVLLLNESKFYHIGTTKEYIQHFCKDPVFRWDITLNMAGIMKNRLPLACYSPDVISTWHDLAMH